MADKGVPSKLPVKQDTVKKKWDNTTKILPKVVDTNTPKITTTLKKATRSQIPHIIRALTPDSEIDSFFQKRKPEPSTKLATSVEPGPSINLQSLNQIQPEKSDSIPFGYVEPTISSKQPKRARNYPKPWLSKPTRPNLLADQNAFNMKVSQRLQESQQPKRRLAPAQEDAVRPQFGPETKELALLFANSRRESRAIDKESKLINYDEYEPPWRRTNVENEAVRISIKPPHLVGTKLKIEMKPPRKEKVTVKAPKFLPKKQSNTSSNQYPIGESDRRYPKPWRAEYQQLKSDDERASIEPPNTKVSQQDGNGNKAKPLTFLSRLGGIDHLQSKMKSSNYSVRPPSSQAGFTFEEAVRGVTGWSLTGRNREEFSSYELEIEPEPMTEEEENDKPISHDHKRRHNRMPLRTRFYPKQQPKSEIEKTQPQHGTLFEDEPTTDFETDVEDIVSTDNGTEVRKHLPGQATMMRRSSRHFKTPPKSPELILPRIIKSGEFHAKQRKSGVSETSTSSSSDDDAGTEDDRMTTTTFRGHTSPYEIATTDDAESIRPPKPKSYTKTNPKRQPTRASSSSPNRISDNVATASAAPVPPKKFSTRLPVAVKTKKVKIPKGPPRKAIGSRKIQMRKQPKVESTKTISDSKKIATISEKVQVAERLFSTLSYTIVRNKNGDGMMKLFEDGTTVPILEKGVPGLHSIMFTNTDVKVLPQIPLNGASKPAQSDMISEYKKLVESVVEIANKPSYTVTMTKLESNDNDTLQVSTDDKATLDFNNDWKDIPDSTSYTLIAANKTASVTPKSAVKPDSLKPYMQPVQPKGTEKQCYTAEVVWDRMPFTTQNFVETNIPEQPSHRGAELLTIFPPPTAYMDEKQERTVGLADKIHDSKATTGNYQFYENSGQPSGFSGSIGLNIINLNYMSSSSSQSIQKSKREYRPVAQVPPINNASPDHKREIYGIYKERQIEIPEYQDSRFYDQQQRQCCNNGNMSSCPYSHNQHYEPYPCFHQIFEDDFSHLQYPASNSRLPKGNFLPPIVTQVRRECHDCTNKYCYACSYSENQKTGMNSKYYGQSYQQQEEFPQFYWPNREYPHSCDYRQCEHQQESEYWHQQQTKGRIPEKYQQTLPFTSVKSSVAFTVTGPSDDFVHSSKPTAENTGSFLPKLKIIGADRNNSSKNVFFEDCNKNICYKKENTKSLQDSHTVQVISDDSGSEYDSSHADDESTDGNEDPNYRSPEPRRTKSHESKIIFDETMEHGSVRLNKYLLQLFLEKPSTAKRTHRIPYASPPPPTVVSADSSNASIRVLMSRDENRLLALPNCNCSSCRKCHEYLGTHKSRSMTCLDQIDYVRKNIKETKKFKKKIPENPNRVVDHPKGDRVAPIILFAGRKGYGTVPDYIKKRKTEILAEKQARIDAELDRTIERLNAIEDRRKKTRRYWIKQVAEQTRKKGDPEFDEQENSKRVEYTRTARLPPSPLPPSKRDDIIFIGSYHSDVGGNNGMDKGHTEVKPSKLTPSKCLKENEKSLTPTEFDTLTDKRLRQRTGSAPRNLKPFSPRASVSNSSLLPDVRVVQSVPDNVDYS